jgi:aminoglycoside phosphotransferase (APT) family kinase protein
MESSRPREPDMTTITGAIQRHLNRSTPIECGRSSEGGEHVVWFIGADYVFRALPRSEEAVDSLKREAAIRQLVKRYQVNVELVPAFIDVLAIDGWVGNLDVRVSGSSLESRLATARTEADVTNFVKAQWRIPAVEAEAVVGNERVTVELEDLIPHAHRSWQRLLATGYAVDQNAALATLLKIDCSALIASPNETIVLLHNDFKGEHILLKPSESSEADGALAGIIDWSDAAIGDVAVDVGGLSVSLGRQMAKRIALNAGVSLSATARGITMAMCDSVINLDERIHGDDRDSPELLLRRQFQRVFEQTVLENALV